MQADRKQIEKTLNALWQLHDEAQNAGDKASAHEYAARAFELVGQLPENQVYLQTQQ